MVEIFHRFADYPIQCKLGLKFGDFFHRHSPTIFILLVRDFHFIISLFKVKTIVQNCLSVTRMQIVSLMAELSTALVNLVTHEMEKIVQVKNPIRTGIKLILQSKYKNHAYYFRFCNLLSFTVLAVVTVSLANVAIKFKLCNFKNGFSVTANSIFVCQRQ